jgi:predicted nucleic acid-binding protein
MNLIVDANVLTSAVLGRSIDLLFDLVSRGIGLLTPVRMMIEAEKVIASKNKLAPAEAFRRLALLNEMVEVIGGLHYEAHEGRARERLSAAGQSDWPVLAASLALDASIWSNDRHFFGVGVPVWSTYNVKYLEAA